jgi:hypothetical protein
LIRRRPASEEQESIDSVQHESNGEKKHYRTEQLEEGNKALCCNSESNPSRYVLILLMLRGRKFSLVLIFAFTAGAAGVLGSCSNDDGDTLLSSAVEGPADLVLDADVHAGNDLKPDPQQWKGEAFAEEADKALKMLAGLLSASDPVAEEAVRALVTEGSQGRLTPELPVTVFTDETITIRASDVIDESASWQGPAAFSRELQSFRESFGDATELSVSLKIVGLKPGASEGMWTSTVRMETRVQRVTSILQHRADYLCQWVADPAPILTSLMLQRWEAAESSSPQPWFRNQTVAVLGINKALVKQLSFGLDHWLRRIGRVHGMTYFKRHGISVGDANGDGLDDVYLCQGGGLPNKLFIQQPDGTAVDQSQAAGVDYLDHTSSALFVDLNNDGDQDLALATFEGVIVLSNQGASLTFQQQAQLNFGETDLHALSAVDFDNDGDLDLYVTVDFAASPTKQFLYHDANDGGPNRLFRNDGQWQFTDVTDEVGIGVHNQRHSLAASWEDADNDGDQDLYVANDYGQNCLYLNDIGIFKETAVDSGIVDYGSGMSVTWGDSDRDGDMDLYVGNMFSSAGSRIVSEPRFLPDAKSRGLYQRFVRGNSLYQNNGTANFTEIPDAGGASRGRWSWSSLFADLNNDGWEDLFAANGYITTEDPGDL